MSEVGAAPGDLVRVVALEFGTNEEVKSKASSSAMGTVCPQNEGIVVALSGVAQVQLIVLRPVRRVMDV